MTKEELEKLYKEYKLANLKYREYRDNSFGRIQNGKAIKALDAEGSETLNRLEEERDKLLEQWKKGLRDLYPDIFKSRPF